MAQRPGIDLLHGPRSQIACHERPRRPRASPVPLTAGESRAELARKVRVSGAPVQRVSTEAVHLVFALPVDEHVRSVGEHDVIANHDGCRAVPRSKIIERVLARYVAWGLCPTGDAIAETTSVRGTSRTLAIRGSWRAHALRTIIRGLALEPLPRSAPRLRAFSSHSRSETTHGDLKTFPLADLLSYLRSSARTGTLSVQRDGGEWEVALVAGRVTG